MSSVVDQKLSTCGEGTQRRRMLLAFLGNSEVCRQCIKLLMLVKINEANDLSYITVKSAILSWQKVFTESKDFERFCVRQKLSYFLIKDSY